MGKAYLDSGPELSALKCAVADLQKCCANNNITGQNLGNGANVFVDKQGNKLRFKSLIAGSGVTITPNGETIKISAGGADSICFNNELGNVTFAQDESGCWYAIVASETCFDNESGNVQFFQNEETECWYGIIDLSEYVPTSRIVDTTGPGILGGGDLTTDRSFSLDFVYLDGRYAPSGAGVTSFNARNGAVMPQLGDYDTTIVAEGTNLYFTDARAITALTGQNLSIFNNDVGYITDLTGDVSAIGPNSAAATLATVNANVGTFGDASNIPQFTVNAKGLITAVTNIPISIPPSGWNLIGNSGTNPSTDFLGTIDAQNLVFRTNNVQRLVIDKTGTATAGIARGVNVTPTLTATANNDTLIGIDVQPTFNEAGFTGVTRWGQRIMYNASGATDGLIVRNLNSASHAALAAQDNTGTRFVELVMNASTSVVAPSYGLVGEGAIRASTSATGLALSAVTGPIRFLTNNGVENVRLFQTGSVLLQTGGTFTDAGYKLDVQGTTRITGQITTNNNTFQTTTSDLNLVINSTANAFRAVRANGYADSFSSIFFQLGEAVATESGWFTARSGNVFQRFGVSALNTTISDVVYTAVVAEPSAVLKVESSTRGFLKPRMTTTQKNAISSPIAGLEVYDTTLNTPFFYNGTTWTSAGGSTLQTAYDASTAPQILTSTSKGALSLRRGSTADTDSVFSIQNNAGVDTFKVLGNGQVQIASTAGQPGFKIFNTVDQTTNTEYAQIAWSSSQAFFIAGNTGTGTARVANFYGTGGTVVGVNAAGSSLVLRGNSGTGAGIVVTIGAGANGITYSTAAAQNGANESIHHFATNNLGGAGATKDHMVLYGPYIGTGPTNINGLRIGPQITNGHTGIKLINLGTNSASTGAIGTHTPLFTVDYTGATMIGGATAVASAILQADSTTRGFLPPRMTAAQASAIASPAQGLTIFVTSTDATFTSVGGWQYNGVAWVLLGAVGAGTQDFFLNSTSNSLYSALAGNGGATASARNIFIGSTAGNSTLTGIDNYGVGSRSLNALTTGNGNIAIGLDALRLATTITNTIAIGVRALDAYTTSNTADDHVAIGTDALGALTSSANVRYSVAIGRGALANCNSPAFAIGNDAIGALSLNSLTTGWANLGVGSASGQGIQTGTENTAVGNGSMFVSHAAASQNVGVGYNTLRITSTATYTGNTGVGYQALSNAISAAAGSFNTALGYRAFNNEASNALTGSYNIGLGHMITSINPANSHQLIIGGNNIRWLLSDLTGGSSTRRWVLNGTAANITATTASAALDVQSTTGGLKLPTMTATQASAIASPADGLMLYVTSTDATFTSVGFWGRIAGVWTALHL